MGSRGPIRDPNSRRGQAEIRKQQRINELDAAAAEKVTQSIITQVDSVATSALPVCPTGLPKRVAETWLKLVIDLAAAQVPIRQIDSHAILMAARCLVSAETAELIAMDAETDTEHRIAALRLQSGFSKDLVQWLQLICATPGTRARIGLKVQQEKPKGALAKILEAKLKRGSQ